MRDLRVTARNGGIDVTWQYDAGDAEAQIELLGAIADARLRRELERLGRPVGRGPQGARQQPGHEHDPRTRAQDIRIEVEDPRDVIGPLCRDPLQRQALPERGDAGDALTDFVGTEAELGKPVGGDLREGGGQGMTTTPEKAGQPPPATFQGR